MSPRQRTRRAGAPHPHASAQRPTSRSSRWISRAISRLRIVSRLSYRSLPLRQRDLDLGPRARPREVDPRRHQRQPALLGACPTSRSISRRCSSSLRGALGIVVVARRRPVGRDVDADQPHLAVAHRRVGVLELGLALAQRLDLGARQHHPRLEALEQVVAIRRLAVGGDVTRRRLALRPLAIAHSSPELIARAADPPDPAAASIAVDPHPHRVAEPDRAAAARAHAASCACSLSSHQSPRSRRTGSRPSNAAGPRRRRTRRRRSARRPRRRSRLRARRRTARARAGSSGDVVGVALDRHRLALARRASTAPAAATHAASGAASPPPTADSSARWQTRSG